MSPVPENIPAQSPDKGHQLAYHWHEETYLLRILESERNDRREVFLHQDQHQPHDEAISLRRHDFLVEGPSSAEDSPL